MLRWNYCTSQKRVVFIEGTWHIYDTFLLNFYGYNKSIDYYKIVGLKTKIVFLKVK